MMPLSDLTSGPDINFVSARSVYPTMRGGSTASAAGAMTANTNVTTADPATGQAAAATAAAPVLPQSKRTIWWWVGALALMAALIFAARKAGGAEDFRNIRPTAYNFLTITFTAILGIVAMKVLAARFRVPGASDLILAA